MKMNPIAVLPLFVRLCAYEYDADSQVETQVLLRAHWRDLGMPPLDEAEFRKVIEAYHEKECRHYDSRFTWQEVEEVLARLSRILSCMQSASNIGKNWVRE